jgi:hypothetical protein
VNKALPRVEQELEQLIEDWEGEHQTLFLVGGVSFKDFIASQKEDHMRQLESEKEARGRQKKETLLQETRYGARPSTPMRLKGHNLTVKMTPKKQIPTPSKIINRMSSVMATMRSPRAGRVAKGTSPRVGGRPASKTDESLRGKRRSSYGIKRGDKKNKKSIAAQQNKMKKGILTENSYTINGNDTIVRRGVDTSVASTVPDYGSFKQGNMLNSTEAGSLLTPEISRPLPGYMTPTQATQHKGFKTPNTPTSRSRTRLTPGGTGAQSKLSLRSSSSKMPFLF